MPVEFLVAIVVLLALFFTYTNGFQDGSSVVACAITCGALTPIQAVALTACLEILGCLFGGSAVASTIQSITNWPQETTLLPVLTSALLGAIGWNYITRLLRFPSSSTHALVGGMLGSLLAANGNQFIVWGNFGNFINPYGVWKVVLTLFAAPIISFVVAYALYLLLALVLLRASWSINNSLKSMQWMLVAALAFGHGSNDPQKSMGTVMLALYSAGMIQSNEIPLPLRIGTAIAIALGIMSLVPGIVKRVGTGIYKLRTFPSFVSQLASASVIVTGSLTGGPVSASQVVASSVMGVGSAGNSKGVHWLVAQEIFLAWFATIPGAGLLSSVLYFFIFKWLHAVV